MTPNAWKPVLQGSARKEALATVDAIVAALPRPRSEAIDEASLAGGAAGMAVLCAYLARAGFDDGENACAFLEQAVDALSEVTFGASFFSGYPGVAWTIAHLREQLLDDPDDLNEGTDAALDQALDRWDAGYDLVNGMVGVGVYASSRLPRPAARKIIEKIVLRLHDTAEQNDDGATWFTPASGLPTWQRELYPHGYYNLGMAHGVPGVIVLLAAACRAGVARDRALPLLERAVSWLLQRKLPDGAPGRFPNWIGRTERQDFKLAWCYGDMGVAASLLIAARCVARSDWESEAVDVARNAAVRPPDRAHVLDAGLCHGAAGVAHIFNRFFQTTGERDFRDAARRWYGRTLAMKSSRAPLGGYAARYVVGKGEEVWRDTPGLLTGAAGIALALLSAATDVEPQWDQMLLLSIPSVGNS